MLNEKFNDGKFLLLWIIVEMKLLDYLGVSLNLDECALCGNKEGLITIDISIGGVICKDCYSDGYIMNSKALHLMVLLKKVNIEKLETLEITDEDIFKEIDKFIYEYYTSYTGIYIKKKDNMLI